MASQLPTTDDYTTWMHAASNAEEGRGSGLTMVGALLVLLALAAVLL